MARGDGNGNGGAGPSGNRGGGNHGGNSSGASPSRSTPGSPSAADGNRGSTMGAKGGSAGPAGNSSRGGPGLGVGLDGSLNGGFGADIGKDPGPSGGLKGSSSAGESIAGSKDARYSFNSPDAGEMASLRSRDRAARSLGGLGAFGVEGTDQGGIANGEVAGDSPLDTTTEGYKTIVGDPELSLNRELNESLMQERDIVTPSVRIEADKLAFKADKDRVDEATDDNPLRSFIPGPLEALADLGENYAAKEKYAKDLADISDQLSLQDGYFGKPGFMDATEAAIAEGTGGLIGNRDRMGRVAVGIAEDRSNKPGIGGKNNGSRSTLNPEIPPTDMADKSVSKGQSSTNIGGISNYSSYARSVFSNV